MNLTDISYINYKGYQIQLADNSHCALIYKGEQLVKCIAGDIDGSIIWANGKHSNNRISKACNYINSLSA